MRNLQAGALGRISFFGLIWLAAMLWPGWLLAQPPVTLAVLSFRPKPDMLARWQPTADYLSARTGRQFILEALNYPELEAAISQRRVDFVLTNPAHYVLMTRRSGLTSPLATLIQIEHGQPLTQFGGVVVTRAERSDIAELADLGGKSIATPDIGSFGGFQMQAYELSRLGLSTRRDMDVVVTGMPHDTALQSLLENKVDAAFVRTGVIEALADAGKLDMARVKVVARRQVPGFPFLLSTRLYPEWPIAAMPQTSQALAQQVATALFALRPDHPATLAGHYHGWSVPTDYEPVRDLMLELRLPPFDDAPNFTWRDVVAKHGTLIMLTTLAGLSVVVALYLLMVRQRDLHRQDHKLAEERKQLLAALGEGVYGVDMTGRCTFINPAALSLLGYGEEEMLGREQHALIHHHRADGAVYPAADCPIYLTLTDGRLRSGEEWFIRKDGSGFPVEMTVAATERDGHRSGAVVVFHDISARQEAQVRDRLLVSALEAVANGIVITDPEAHIEWVNPAFEALTGYRREEATGRKPAELVKSGLQTQEFYEAMWKTLLAGQTWRGEVINKKRDGSFYNEELTITPVLDEAGGIRHFVGIKQDISIRKRMEAELHNLATTDSLTGLPNRRQFLALLEQENARVKRFPEDNAVLLMLDLDHFKLINDQYGHAAGDMVLRSFAVQVRDNLRRSDLAGRLGGEEFAILLIGSDLDGAREFADRLRQDFSADQTLIEGKPINATVSIGVTSLLPTDGNADVALARADRALYRAKEAGRNRVEVEAG